ncbi:MAG: hypothetical protein WBK28_03560 [Minisyncoccia bacterium]
MLYRDWLRARRLAALRRTNALIRKLKRFMDARRAAASHWGEELVLNDWHWHNLHPLLEKRERLATLLGIIDLIEWKSAQS